MIQNQGIKRFGKLLRVGVLLGIVAACGKEPVVSPDSPVDTAIDPCREVDCGEHGACVAIEAEAACECEDGFEAEALSCVDIDECADDNGGCGIEPRYACENNEGQAPTCTDRCEDLESSIEAVENPASGPPMSGTVWFHKDIITEEDPSSFLSTRYTGQGERVMFDRRTASWETLNAHLFETQFAGDITVEVQVNPEFSAEEAEAEALFYAEVIGRMPAFLFRDVQTVWIHRGVEPYGGGNYNLLIHTGQTAEYLRDEVLEEVFIHEAAHTSMDAYHAAEPMWLAAQEADGVAISTYAMEHPNREDIAETLGPYLAYRHRSDRLKKKNLKTLESTIPNRLLYFDCLDLEMDILK